MHYQGENMQRRLRITVAVAAAVSSVALTAGTALADDNGPVNINNDGSHSSHEKTPNLDKSNLQLPEVGGALGGH
jgi:hypothetical protein